MPENFAYSLTDRFIATIDQGLRTLFSPASANRPNPAREIPEATLSPTEKQSSGTLMRINHVGEVCAQALYRGQALTARSQTIQKTLEKAAEEETDHLAWCQERLTELNSRPSFLNPLWYTGAFTLGMIAGIAGDKWSLGFVAETERQVEKHLQSHLTKLPLQDKKTRLILEQMCEDEAQHATIAETCGAVELPQIVKNLMTFCSKVMTTTAYWI